MTMRPLALLRVAIAIVALLSPEPAIARVVAERSRALWTVPEGLGWLGSIVPLDPTAVTVATAVLRASAVLAILGFFRRGALAVLALMLLYVFGAAQLTGTVTHDMHLFWFAALLACVRRGEDDPRALAIARLWLGLVYFFPGVHKLAHGGLAWVTSDNLVHQMYFKWYEAGGVAPWPRIDRVPHLVNVLAAGVVAFELAMPLLVSLRRTRLAALVLGLLFHLSAGHFLDVLFPSLVACYVVLLPERPRTTAAPRNRARSLVAALFTSAIVVQGARGETQAFPFACYPTFATIAGDEIVDLAVDVDGKTYRLPRVRRPDEWGMVWRLAGLYGDPIDPERHRAFAHSVAPQGRARVFAEGYDVRPEAWSAPPRRRVLIHEDPK
jgi:hypothetical protein